MAGKAVLPAAWIEGVRSADVDMHESWSADMRYGRQFWVVPRPDTFMAVGYHRQLVVVMPGLDIVAVATGSSRFASPSGSASTPRYGLDALAGFLAAAVTSDGAVAANPAATAELAERVKAAALEQPAQASAAGPPALVKAVSGKIWRCTGNPARLKSLTLKHDDPQPSYEYELDPGPPWFRQARSASTATSAWAAARAWARALRAAPPRPMAPASCGGAVAGQHDIARVTLVFGDRTVEVSADYARGFRSKLQGRTDD